MTHLDSSQTSLARNLTVAAIGVWLLAATAAGVTGAVNAPGQPPLQLAVFVGVPISIGITAYALSSSVRAWALGLSLTWLVGLHIWRVVGLGFVLAWLLGELPGSVAIPEGLGDVAAAAGALALLPGLRRGTASRGWLLAWNTFGLVDLVSAITMGVLYSNSALGVLATGGVTTELMVTFPVSLIPTFLVPLFILMHLLTFAKLARSRAVEDEAWTGIRRDPVQSH